MGSADVVRWVLIGTAGVLLMLFVMMFFQTKHPFVRWFAVLISSVEAYFIAATGTRIGEHFSWRLIWLLAINVIAGFTYRAWLHEHDDLLTRMSPVISREAQKRADAATQRVAFLPADVRQGLLPDRIPAGRKRSTRAPAHRRVA
jgi:hypothetical protein